MKGKLTATGLLTLVALVVLGAFSAGSASAASFLWTGPLPGLLLVLSESPQIFTVAGSPASVVCEHFGAHGILSNGKGMTTKEVTITGLYSKCTVPALAGAPATVTPARFLLNANGTVAVVQEPIVITIPGANCSIKINNDGGNNNLSTLKFLNLPSDVLVDVSVKNITALLSNAKNCATETEEVEIHGSTYSGLLLAFVDGGSLKWDTTP
jgi:hypothetical protein